MKYCEKCGNELKEGFAFCDKCGAKIEKAKKDSKKEEKEEKKVVKEEKKEPVVKERPVPPVPPVPPFPPKKPGKGKMVFLTILNILLLGAAITFLVLWLTRPNGDCSCDCPKCGVEPPVTEKKYVGKWEQNLEYKSGSKVFQRIYGMIELKDNGKFESLFYDKDNKSSTTEEISGTYTVSGSSVVLSYTENGKKQTTTMVLSDKKLCFKDETENCLVKDSYNNKVTIYKDEPTSDIEYITYTDYVNLQKNYKDAIVVVVHEGCSYCEKYEPVVEEIAENYSTPVYYYENDGKINVNSTPTTIVIKNGYIVDSYIGYMTYSAISEKLDDLGVK